MLCPSLSNTFLLLEQRAFRPELPRRDVWVEAHVRKPATLPRAVSGTSIMGNRPATSTGRSRRLFDVVRAALRPAPLSRQEEAAADARERDPQHDVVYHIPARQPALERYREQRGRKRRREGPHPRAEHLCNSVHGCHGAALRYRLHQQHLQRACAEM